MSASLLVVVDWWCLSHVVGVGAGQLPAAAPVKQRHLLCHTLNSLYMSIANKFHLIKAQYINKKGIYVSGSYNLKKV